MDLSLVITTYNRADVLERLLRSLESQTDRDFQVVVAIDGSTDHTVSMLQELQVGYDLKWVNTHCTGYGLAIARNSGILESDGDAVAIIDDDSIPSPNFIAAHKISCSRNVITGGPRNPANKDERMEWKMLELSRLPPLTPMTIEDLRSEWPNVYLVENNICLLRQDWISMGLFSERLKLYGFIGQEFFARAAHLGLRYQFNPTASVQHHGDFEGDNGFHRRRKLRQTRLATLIRPALETPEQFQAQIDWATAMATGRPISKLPGFALDAGFLLAKRLVRKTERTIIRPLRQALWR
jgi:glycosyltransferase involved in cell wall biosynthesis